LKAGQWRRKRESHLGYGVISNLNVHSENVPARLAIRRNTIIWRILKAISAEKKRRNSAGVWRYQYGVAAIQ
jgi:hypothetical protein